MANAQRMDDERKLCNLGFCIQCGDLWFTLPLGNETEKVIVGEFDALCVDQAREGRLYYAGVDVRPRAIKCRRQIDDQPGGANKIGERPGLPGNKIQSLW